MTKIHINDATVAQLRTFAEEVLGLDVRAQDTRKSLQAKIGVVHVGDEIELPDHTTATFEAVPTDAGTAPEQMRAATAKSVSAKSGRGDPLVRLVVHENESEEGKRPVFVAVNGTGMLIPRGREVEIPYRYYLVLRDTIVSSFRQDMESAEKEMRESRQPVYPFNVTRLPSQEEVDAWKRATGKLLAA